MSWGVAQYTCPLVTGTLDITSSDVDGAAVKAALFAFSRCLTLGTPRVDVANGFGATDLTNERSYAFSARDGVGTTIADRQQDEADAIEVLYGGFTNQISANVTTAIADGVRANFSQTDDAAQHLALLIGGPGVSAHVGQVVIGAVDVEVDVTGPGFTPDVVFFFTAGRASPGVGGYAVSNFGFCINDGANTQKSLGWVSVDNVGAADLRGAISANRCAISPGNGTVSYTVECTNFDANGFSIFPRIGGGGSDDLFYLAIKDTNRVFRASSFDSPTAAGNFSLPSYAGVTPEFRMILLSGLTAEDAADTTDKAGPQGVAFIAENSAHCVSWTEDDAAGTTNAQTLVSAQAIDFPDHLGATFFKATQTDMGTLNFANADATVRKWAELVVGTASAAKTVTLSLEAAVQKQRAMAASLNAALQASALKTVTLDAALAAVTTALASLEAALEAPGSRGASLDGALRAGKSAESALAAAILATKVRGAGLDAHLTGAVAATIAAGLDSALLRLQGLTALIDAALSQKNSSAAVLDAGVALSREAGALVDSAVARAGLLPASLDTVLLRLSSVTAGIDALIGDQFGRSKDRTFKVAPRGAHRVAGSGRALRVLGSGRGFKAR